MSRREDLANTIGQLHATVRNAEARLHDKLTFKQYQSYSRSYRSSSVYEAVAKVSKSKQLLRLASSIDSMRAELSSLYAQQARMLEDIERRYTDKAKPKQGLRLVYSKPADWHELTLRKINKRLGIQNDNRNEANLRIASRLSKG